jgi:FkbM family methyltransferase
MLERLKEIIVLALERFLKVKVLRKEAWGLLAQLEPANEKLLRWSHLTEIDFFGLRKFILENIKDSPSQLQQDLVAQFIFLLSNKSTKKLRPFFVEIGANDGVYLSNTYLLEKHFGWKGILSEANDNLRESLELNRKGSHIDSRAVTQNSGELIEFTIAENSEYSAVRSSSVHVQRLANASHIIKESVNLTELLREYSAPAKIDFLSIDTEGNELEILLGLDFKSFHFNFVAVEVSRDSERIAGLLGENGYTQILSQVSKWDQWWINSELLRELHKALPVGNS